MSLQHSYSFNAPRRNSTGEKSGIGSLESRFVSCVSREACPIIVSSIVCISGAGLALYPESMQSLYPYLSVTTAHFTAKVWHCFYLLSSPSGHCDGPSLSEPGLVSQRHCVFQALLLQNQRNHIAPYPASSQRLGLPVDCAQDSHSSALPSTIRALHALHDLSACRAVQCTDTLASLSVSLTVALGSICLCRLCAASVS